MLSKLKFGTSIAALFLFFLPWLEISCSEKSIATQSGVQIIYGSGSVSDGLNSLGGKSGDSTKVSEKPKESMGFSLLVGIAFLCVIGSVVFSFRNLLNPSDKSAKLALLLPTIALVCLLLQLMIGFPIKKKMTEAMSENQSEQKISSEGDPLAGLGQSMAGAMMMAIQVKKTPFFYFELFSLGLPTLLLFNGLIDKHKRGEQGAALDG